MIHSKKCFKCETVKPLTEFYKHPAMLDGHVNKCKECNKLDVRENRFKKITYYRDYDKERAKTPERIKFAKEQLVKWRGEDKRRGKCHNAVAHALKRGKLKKQPCFVCATDKNIIGHHEDYDKPLYVIWMCQSCHVAYHKNKFELLLNILKDKK